MKKLFGILLLMVVATGAAFADPVPVDVGPLSLPTGIYGPYFGTVTDNTGTSVQPLICFAEDLGLGAPWNGGLKYSISTVGGQMGLDTSTYNVLGFLADELFADPGNKNLQRAIWKEAGFVPVDWFNQFSAADQTDINNKITAAVNAVAAGFVTGDYFLFPPASSSGAQPLIERAPEPGSLLLLGSGIFGMAGVIRRKMLR
jgi:hypothetical protein